MCDHISALSECGFIESEMLIDVKTGMEHKGAVLYSLTEGKNGRLFVGRNRKWIEVQYCPLCGEKIEGNQ